MTYPVNTFHSNTHPGLTTTPGSILDSSTIPANGHALILSIMVSNKTGTNKNFNSTLRKAAGVTHTHLGYNVVIEPGMSFELLKGAKVVVNRDDVLRAWVEAGDGSLDLVISYVVYSPAG